MRLLLTWVLVLLSCGCFSQDPYFIHANQSLIYLNPSFAGTNGMSRNQFSVRNEWPRYSQRYLTVVNSLDLYIQPIRGGLAFSALSDDQTYGVVKTKVYSIAYAQHLGFFDERLKIIPSLQYSYSEKTVDPRRFRFPGFYVVGRSPIAVPDPTVSARTKYFTEFNSGLLINFEKDLYLGMSVFHLNRPDEGVFAPYFTPMRLSLHGSYTVHFNEDNLLQFLYRHTRQAENVVRQAGCNFIVAKYLVCGVSYLNTNYDTEYGLFYAGYNSGYFSITTGFETKLDRTDNPGARGGWEIDISFGVRSKKTREITVGFESM